MRSRILIIDDNKEIHDDIKKILRSSVSIRELDELESEIFGVGIHKKKADNITIDSALQGAEGIDMGLKALNDGNPYAVAFVDIRMPPGIDGVKTIQRLRALDNELQFVIITAYSDYNLNEIHTAVDGGDGNLLILKKPFDSIEIRQLVSALTKKWTLSRIEKKHQEQLQAINIELESEIIERINTQKTLEKNEEHIRLIMDSTAEGIYGLDLNGRCSFCNNACLHLLGYSDQKELLGNMLHGMIHHTRIDGSHHLPTECPIHNTIKYQEKIHSDTDIFWTKDGGSFRVEYWSYPILKDNEIKGVVVTFIDISNRIFALEERKRLLIQLQQAQKMEAIGALAGGIAHDFNNILFPIMGYTEMLIQEVPADSPVQTKLQNIHTAVLRAKSLVRQILTFSRHGKIDLELIMIQPIIKEALKLIRSTIPTTIDVKQDIQKDCGLIKADPTQIHQIIMNLTTNAYHAMEKDGGELKVSLKEIESGGHDVTIPDMKPGTCACLCISDTGIGMDHKLKNKIFDPFFTTKKNGKGTGIGLSVVHSIVTDMGGRIEAFSEPDKGTVFKVYFPIEKSSLIKQTNQAKEQIQGGKERILLVDDEISIIAMGKLFLEQLGYRVTSHISSFEALDVFRSNPDKFDLVITDMAMPKMSGDKLSTELRKLRSDIPILLCTGFSDIMSEEEALSKGINGFLMKPIVITDFAQKIREVLAYNK